MTRIFILSLLTALVPSAFADIPKTKFTLSYTAPRLQIPISIRQGPQPVLVKKEPAAPAKFLRWILAPLHIPKRPALTATFKVSFPPAGPVVKTGTSPRLSFGATNNQNLFGARIRLPNWSLRKSAPPKGTN